MGYLVKIMQSIYDHRGEIRAQYEKVKFRGAEALEVYCETDGMIVDAEKICGIDMQDLPADDTQKVWDTLLRLWNGKPLEGE